jgi:hypothetical protein
MELAGLSAFESECAVAARNEREFRLGFNDSVVAVPGTIPKMRRCRRADSKDRARGEKTNEQQRRTGDSPMKFKLLTTVAAAALMASAGLASAQMTKGEKPDMPAASGMQQQPGSNAEDRGKADDRTKPGAMQPRDQRPQGAQSQQGTQSPSQGAQRQQGQPTQGATPGTAQGQTGSGAANVTLNAEQKTKIRQTIIQKSGAPRVSNVNFSLSVGTVVPRDRVKFVAVPPTLVEIHPAWRGYMYFIVDDQLIIVEPSSNRIVAVVTV